MHDQGPYDRDALLLSSGELPGEAFRLVLQADSLQKPERLLLRIRFCALLHLQGRQRHIVQYVQMREKVIALEDHADLLAYPRKRFAVDIDLLSLEQYFAGLDLLQRVDAAKERTLSAAGRAEDHDDLSLLYIKIDSLEYSVFPESFRDTPQCQYCITHNLYPCLYEYPFMPSASRVPLPGG